MALQDEFLAVAQSRRTLLAGMLEADLPIFVAKPIQLGIDLTQVAIDSVAELEETLARGLGLIEGKLQHARIEQDRLERDSATLAAKDPQEARRTRSLRELALTESRVNIQILEKSFQLLTGVGAILLFRAESAYCKTFAGEALTGFREKLKDALQDQLIAGMDAALETTLIPFMARVINLFKGWKPLIEKSLPETIQWHRDMDEYLETAVNYAAIVDSFIKVAAAGGSVEIDDSTLGNWESRVQARLNRVRLREGTA